MIKHCFILLHLGLAPYLNKRSEEVKVSMKAIENVTSWFYSTFSSIPSKQTWAFLVELAGMTS